MGSPRDLSLVSLFALVVAGVGCVEGNLPVRPVVASDPSLPLVSAPECGGMDLAVRDDTLFWTEKTKGTIKSIPTAGGPTSVIASNQGSPTVIAVDPTGIYWIASSNKAVVTRPRVGGSVRILVPATAVPEVFGVENDINAMLVESGTLFFGRYTFALKIPVTGGVAPAVIGMSPLEDLGKPSAFAIDAKYLYQTEIFHQAVSRETTDGKQNGLLEDGVTRHPFAPDRIAVSQGSLLVDAIARWGDSVVWADGPTILRKAVDASERTPSLRVASTMGGNDVTGFVVSGDKIYFGEGGSSRTIQVASLPSGEPTVIATSQINPRHFAADAGNIYWATDDCTIMRFPK